MSSDLARHAIAERIELLSSSSEKSMDSGENNPSPSQTTETAPNQVKQDRPRFRERVYSLFSGSRRRKEPGDDEDADGEDNSRSSLLSMEEDEEIAKLKELINNQETTSTSTTTTTTTFTDTGLNSQSRDSLYDEETYINTIKNQHIPLLPDEIHDEQQQKQQRQASEKKEEQNNIPFTKLFLHYHPDQATLYRLERKLTLEDLHDYQLAYPWILSQAEAESQHAQGSSSRSITVQSKLDMTEIMVAYKKLFKRDAPFWVQLMKKTGYDNLERGSESEAKMAMVILKVRHSKGYRIWKAMLRIFLDDKFRKAEDLSVYALRNTVVKLRFEKRSDAVMLRVFITRGGGTANSTGTTALEICEFLKSNCDEELRTFVDAAKWCEGAGAGAGAGADRVMKRVYETQHIY